MSKHMTLVALLILSILTLRPDVPKEYFNPEATVPGETEVVFGPVFRYEDQCAYGTSHRWELGESSHVDGWASLLVAVDLRDHCNSEDGTVVDRWVLWGRVGFRPANSQLPVFGYWSNPYARWFGLFNWWGSPILAISVPKNSEPFVAWWASPRCTNPIQSECRYPARKSPPTTQVLLPYYPEGYNALWDSKNDQGLKFEPLTPRFLNWLLLPLKEPPESSA